MKAVITFSPNEIANLVRQHLLKVQGIDKIQGMTCKAELDSDECPCFTGVEVNVELKENH